MPISCNEHAWRRNAEERGGRLVLQRICLRGERDSHSSAHRLPRMSHMVLMPMLFLYRDQRRDCRLLGLPTPFREQRSGGTLRNIASPCRVVAGGRLASQRIRPDAFLHRQRQPGVSACPPFRRRLRRCGVVSFAAGTFALTIAKSACCRRSCSCADNTASSPASVHHPCLHARPCGLDRGYSAPASMPSRRLTKHGLIVVAAQRYPGRRSSGGCHGGAFPACRIERAAVRK